MWDQFESSARLLPSPEEEKETEVSSQKEGARLQSLVAEEEQNTLASVGGVQQDLFPSPSDAEQATFAFYGARQEEQTPVDCPENKDATAVVVPAFEEQSLAPVTSTTHETNQIEQAVAVTGDEAVVIAGHEPVEIAGTEPVAIAGDEILEVPLEELTATPEKKLGAAPADISVPAGDEKVIDKQTEAKTGEVAGTKTENATRARDGKEAKTSPSRDPRTERPFRVKLRGSVLVLVRLPNKRSVRGAFHQLSTSGGVIHLEKPLDEKLEVELIFHIQEKTIRNHAQMLFPMWATQGWMQPFRFVDLADKSREILDARKKTFLGDMTKGAGAGA